MNSLKKYIQDLDVSSGLSIVKHYYFSILNDKFDEALSCLDDSIHFISPFGEIQSKEGVISAAKGLSKTLKDIKIREALELKNKVMIVYDFIFDEPVGLLRSAGFMEIIAGKISKIELFYDTHPFKKS